MEWDREREYAMREATRWSHLSGLMALAGCFGANAGPWDVGGLGVDKKRKVKVEVQLQSTSDADSWALPVIAYAHPLNERTSVEVSYGYGFIDRGEVRHGGARDLELKLKARLGDRADGGLYWLVEPKLSFPTGSRSAAQGRGRHAITVPLRVGKKLGSYAISSELRYTHVLGEPSGSQLVGIGGLVEYHRGDEWVVGVDLFADSTLGGGDGVHLRSTFAAKWRPSQDYELQLMLGRTIRNARGLPRTTFKVVAERKF